jgi:hypothetical protein
MPSPKRGQVPRQAAIYPAMRFGYESPIWRDAMLLIVALYVVCTRRQRDTK